MRLFRLLNLDIFVFDGVCLLRGCECLWMSFLVFSCTSCVTCFSLFSFLFSVLFFSPSLHFFISFFFLLISLLLLFIYFFSFSLLFSFLFQVFFFLSSFPPSFSLIFCSFFRIPFFRLLFDGRRDPTVTWCRWAARRPATSSARSCTRTVPRRRRRTSTSTTFIWTSWTTSSPRPVAKKPSGLCGQSSNGRTRWCHLIRVLKRTVLFGGEGGGEHEDVQQVMRRRYRHAVHVEWAMTRGDSRVMKGVMLQKWKPGFYSYIYIYIWLESWYELLPSPPPLLETKKMRTILPRSKLRQLYK